MSRPRGPMMPNPSVGLRSFRKRDYTCESPVRLRRLFAVVPQSVCPNGASRPRGFAVDETTKRTAVVAPGMLLVRTLVTGRACNVRSGARIWRRRAPASGLVVDGPTRRRVWPAVDSGRAGLGIRPSVLGRAPTRRAIPAAMPPLTASPRLLRMTAGSPSFATRPATRWYLVKGCRLPPPICPPSTPFRNDGIEGCPIGRVGLDILGRAAAGHRSSEVWPGCSPEFGPERCRSLSTASTGSCYALSAASRRRRIWVYPTPSFVPHAHAVRGQIVIAGDGRSSL